MVRKGIDKLRERFWLVLKVLKMLRYIMWRKVLWYETSHMCPEYGRIDIRPRLFPRNSTMSPSLMVDAHILCTMERYSFAHVTMLQPHWTVVKPIHPVHLCNTSNIYLWVHSFRLCWKCPKNVLCGKSREWSLYIQWRRTVLTHY